MYSLQGCQSCKKSLYNIGFMAIKMTCSIKQVTSSFSLKRKFYLGTHIQKKNPNRLNIHKPWILLHFVNIQSFLCLIEVFSLVTYLWKRLGYSGIDLFKMSASAQEENLFGCFLLLSMLKNFYRYFMDMLRLLQLFEEGSQTWKLNSIGRKEGHEHGIGCCVSLEYYFPFHAQTEGWL